MEKNGFKDLHVWQHAYSLVLDIYKETGKFPKDELYGLISQLRRAAISVTSNISEGYERRHKKEYIQFLAIAKGSLGEIETQLMLAKDLGYIFYNVYIELENKRRSTIKLLCGLIRSLI